MGRPPRKSGAVHVVTNRRQGKNREYVTHLLRRSYREDGKVKNETVGNISHLPEHVVELVRRALRGELLLGAEEAFEIERSLPAGHVQAALSAARSLDLARTIERQPSRQRALVMAMLVSRVIAPGSKLETSRTLGQSTLASELGVEGASEDELYRALDWLAERQQRIEDRLARRHLADGALVLYDLSSSYFEGKSCPLAARGYSRDKRRGSLQIVYGLLTDRSGRPLAIEVFKGNLHDHQTVAAQIAKLKQRFGLSTVVVVADRGMVTKANIELLAETEGTEWITALKAPQVQRLVRDGELQLSLFDRLELAEISSEAFPGERLVVCRNPLVAAERARKRSEMLAATEAELAAVKARVEAGTLAGAAAIGLAAGAVVNRYKMKKHFTLEIEATSFGFARNEEGIEAEAALDGFYVLRTSVAESGLAAGELVDSYKQLAKVERAFRTLKGPLELRPIHHHLEGRVRAHVFVCMLAYYLEWQLRSAWAELTFKDEAPPERASPVAKAQRSAAAERKAQSKRTRRSEPAHSFESLLAELATVTRNTIKLAGTGATFDKLAKPTPLQARALELAAGAVVTNAAA